jgi:hypothetical protein
MTGTTFIYLGGAALAVVVFYLLDLTDRRRRKKIIQEEKTGPEFVCHPDLQFIKGLPVGKTFSDERTDEQLVAGHRFVQVKVTAPDGIKILGVFKYRCKVCGFTVLRHSPLNINNNETI